RVLTPQGVPVADAWIRVEKEENELHRAVLTRSDGSYAVPDLEQGVYAVRITGPEGQPSLLRHVVVGTPDSSVRIDFRLPIPAAQTSASRDEGNPNIFLYRMDLNALRRRLTIVRGTDPQYIGEFLPERNYFGAEYGAPLNEFTLLNRRSLASRWSYSVAKSLEHSALNARPFFNVGPLRPGRVNQYELSAGGPLTADRFSLTARYAQLHDSSNVNGNVLVPKADERTPRSDDPGVRGIVGNLLRAFPAELPNLPRVTERHLNTNAPQEIENREGFLRLDFQPGENSDVAVRYSITDYAEDPFELVLGRYPQTDLRNQGLRSGATYNFSPSAVGQFGFDFDRATAVLSLTERYRNLFSPLGFGAQVPDVDFKGDSLQDLGPGMQFPRYRVQNRFQLYAGTTKITGRHSLKAGWGIARVQVNDLQSDRSRGILIFAADFGRSEIENFLLGRPTQLIVTRGNLYRGFRSWEHFFYVGDQIRLSPAWSVSLGLRYELQTAPTEVNHLTDPGYSTDGTNFAPRVGFAWNPGGGELTVRGGYGISYGSVFPVTYQFARFNPPAIRTLQISAPDIARLLSIPNEQTSAAERTALNRLSPDLVMPYSHQYSLAVEGPLPGSLFLRLAYVGSRSFHLFTHNVYNRARPVPGIPATTASIDERRPDPRYYDIAQIESNSNAYYDAAQVFLEKRLSRGVAFRATYTFSKSIDLGGDFTNTASGVENPPEYGLTSSEFASRKDDQKGWSLFDTPHNLTVAYTFALPSVGHITGWQGLLLRDWVISGTTVFQSGIPWHPHTGADGPGLGNVDGVQQDRPNLLNPALLGKSFDHPDSSVRLLRREDFDTHIPVGGRGNIGFNTFRKDGANNWNLSVGKAFRFRRWGEASVEFRAAFLNLFNHAQFEKPGFNVTSPSFGQITNTVNRGRVTQLSVRMNF
ncbi:MAG: TonB-dependent receptor domain-containing protein, partial [Terriglobia bacterium]